MIRIGHYFKNFCLPIGNSSQTKLVTFTSAKRHCTIGNCSWCKNVFFGRRMIEGVRPDCVISWFIGKTFSSFHLHMRWSSAFLRTLSQLVLAGRWIVAPQTLIHADLSARSLFARQLKSFTGIFYFPYYRENGRLLGLLSWWPESKYRNNF